MKFLLTILSGKNCVLLNSVQEFIEIEMTPESPLKMIKMLFIQLKSSSRSLLFSFFVLRFSHVEKPLD